MKYQLLKQYFGYDSFRPGQEKLIDSILQGRDVLGIMPTGAGKSICYQIPALIMDGITLVISPLISLMKDQVESLNQAGIHAAYLNSSLTVNQYYKALSLARNGRYPIIYVAPERLLSPEFLDFACSVKISMVAVDEAHCVSQWGQDFRPSYLKIVEFVEQLPKRPVVSAFTATATAQVREDIKKILKLRDPETLITGFDRKNLYFGVETTRDRYGAIADYLQNHREDSGIIYCLTRKVVEDVCQKLQAEGFSVNRYHAGLSDLERKQNQEDFINDRVQVMVATNAFGMGIDKSNVRFVLHYGMPKNLESYYQEAGRAGRDGENAECILYYSPQDVITNQMFIDHNQDNQELDFVTREQVMEKDRERLQKMNFYCLTRECLRTYILNYFGEEASGACGNCSNCLKDYETEDITEAAGAITGCVQSCRERYGVNVILDTVRGAKTARIRQYHMEENPYYGKLSRYMTPELRQIFNDLQLQGYFHVTHDVYAIVKLTEKSRAVLAGTELVLRKVEVEPDLDDGIFDGVLLDEDGDEEDLSGTTASGRNGKFAGRARTSVSGRTASGRATRKKTSASSKRKAGAAALSEEDQILFENLRALRMEIAKEEKIPPYIVFSDKTLISMCQIKPKNLEEMLDVSGVGVVKAEKYGERFLKILTTKENTKQ